MSSDIILGWLFGLISSLVTGILLFWLESLREERRERLRQRLEDTRTALNWQQGSKTSLRGFNLTGINLSGKDLGGVDLESATLDNSILWGTNFSKANLRAVSFKNARAKSLEFTESVLHAADFSGASLDRADFRRADLRKTNFQQAKLLDTCRWEGAYIDETTLLPSLQAQLIREKVRQANNQATPSNVKITDHSNSKLLQSLLIKPLPSAQQKQEK